MTAHNISEDDSSKYCSMLTAGKRTWRYEKRFGWLMVLWALALAACLYSLKTGLVAAPYSWALAVLPLLLAIAPIHAFILFMRHADEMIRKIQIDAIVTSFTVALLYALARTLFAAAGLEEASASDMWTVMLFTFGFAQIYGAWKYR